MLEMSLRHRDTFKNSKTEGKIRINEGQELIQSSEMESQTRGVYHFRNVIMTPTTTQTWPPPITCQSPTFRNAGVMEHGFKSLMCFSKRRPVSRAPLPACGTKERSAESFLQKLNTRGHTCKGGY